MIRLMTKDNYMAQHMDRIKKDLKMEYGRKSTRREFAARVNAEYQEYRTEIIGGKI